MNKTELKIIHELTEILSFIRGINERIEDIERKYDNLAYDVLKLKGLVP